MTSGARWTPVWFLFAGGMINYMDRSAISVVAPLLTKDLGLDPAQLGIVFSSFFAGYALFTFIGGYASDVLGPKRVFTIAMTVWSTFCALTAAAVGFSSLLIVRVCFGFGEGPFSASANKMVSNWFPRHQVATAVGLANAGTPIGGALAGPVAGWLALRYGWRASFVVLAGIGFLWTIFWITMIDDRPASAVQPNPVELTTPDHAGTPSHAPEPRLPLITYIRKPAVLATAISFFGYGFVLFFFLSWFPSYLTMARHLSIRDMGFVNTVPWILGILGLVLSGFVCDLLARVTRNVLGARKIVLVVCLMMSAVCVSLAGIVEPLSSTVAFMSAAMFFNYLTGATYWAMLHEMVRPESIGAVGGFVHLIANFAGIIGPTATGFIVQSTGAFTSAFLMAGAIAFLGATLVAILVRPAASSID